VIQIQLAAIVARVGEIEEEKKAASRPRIRH